MALNQKFDHGDSMSLPVATGTLSGVAVLVGGNLPGTTRNKEGSMEGGTATLRSSAGQLAGFATVDLVGCYEHTVTGALTIGQAVYIPPGGGALTATATANTLWGYALTTKGAGSGLATIRPARV